MNISCFLDKTNAPTTNNIGTTINKQLFNGVRFTLVQSVSIKFATDSIPEN